MLFPFLPFMVHDFFPHLNREELGTVRVCVCVCVCVCFCSIPLRLCMCKNNLFYCMHAIIVDMSVH